MPTESKDELSRSDVEKQIEELKRDKMRIDEDLKRMDATEKRILEQRRRAAEAEPTKAAEDQDGEKKDETEDDKKSREEKAKEAREKRDNDGRPKTADKRSKALFGKMLGHLASAKTRLDTEKGWKSTELHQKAQERLKEKMLLSQVNIADYKKEQFDKHRQEQNARISQIDKAIEAKELLLLQKRLEGHYGLMMNFIRTKSEPTIFYLPAKHIKTTEAMLEDTRAAIKRKIGSLKYELQPEEPEDDETAARRSAAAAAAEAADSAGNKAGSDKGSDAGDDAKDKDGSDDEDEKKSKKDDEDEPAKKKPKADKDGSESGDEKDDKDKVATDKKGEKDASDGSDDN